MPRVFISKKTETENRGATICSTGYVSSTGYSVNSETQRLCSILTRLHRLQRKLRDNSEGGICEGKTRTELNATTDVINHGVETHDALTDVECVTACWSEISLDS